MFASEISTSAQAAAWVAIVAAGLSFLAALYFAFKEGEAVKAVQAAAKKGTDAAVVSKDGAGNPVQPQSAVDYGGLAKLAEALNTLNRSGRFLIAAMAFLAAAAVAGGADAIASAVAK